MMHIGAKARVVFMKNSAGFDGGAVYMFYME
jgi:predicted outer membrane repeat protein